MASRYSFFFLRHTLCGVDMKIEPVFGNGLKFGAMYFTSHPTTSRWVTPMGWQMLATYA